MPIYLPLGGCEHVCFPGKKDHFSWSWSLFYDLIVFPISILGNKYNNKKVVLSQYCSPNCLELKNGISILLVRGGEDVKREVVTTSLHFFSEEKAKIKMLDG